MSKRDFARPRVQAAADQSRHAGGMMRRAERPPIGQRAAFDLAGDGTTMDTSRSSAGASGGRIEGSRAASMDLPSTRRADHEHVIMSMPIALTVAGCQCTN